LENSSNQYQLAQIVKRMLATLMAKGSHPGVTAPTRVELYIAEMQWNRRRRF